MIYLTNTTEAQAVFIPGDVEGLGETLSFELRSTVSLDTVVEATVLDVNETEVYYNVAVQLPEGAPAGEYEYRFKDGMTVVSSGLAIVEESRTVTEYNNAITYEQYKAD